MGKVIVWLEQSFDVFGWSHKSWKYWRRRSMWM